MLTLASYNNSQESVRGALRAVSPGDGSTLDGLLRMRCAAIEVGRIYDRLKELFR
jgi:hypothetical protein